MTVWMDSLIRRVADLDPQRVISEHVFDGKSEQEVDIQYQSVKIVGNGSFGVVFQIRLVDSGRDAAIKRVLQDKRFKVPSFPESFINE
jgi:glycogen synthase kinase 3 beta